MIHEAIKKLICYGLEHSLIEKEDVIYTTNVLLETLGISEYEEPGESYEHVELEPVLSELLDYAYQQGIMEGNSVAYRDLFDTKLMAALVARPSVIIEKFNRLYEKSPREATDFYYQFSQDTDYIRRYRIKKDVKWTTETAYGTLDITINLSKPEKDPKAIAAAKTAKQSGYPKCLLCVENEGYAGRLDHPARQNHRIIPVTIQGNQWGFQYSPYVYYNEHCIVFNSRHIPCLLYTSPSPRDS